VDYKDLIEEIHAEINRLEAGAGDRIRGLFDQLLNDAPAAEPAASTETQAIAD
jgi:hypothetical protein